MRYQGFIGGSFQSQAVTADQEDLINFYVEEANSEGASSPKHLYPSPGVTSLDSIVGGPGRAHFALNGLEWAVIGTSFCSISALGQISELGTVALDSNPATISSNGDGGGEIFITSGGNGYIWNIAAATLTQITALNGLATMGGMVDGYFLALDAATGTMYISDLLDGTTWDPTQFVQRSIAPDPWISLKVLGRYIWLLGSRTSEVWYDVGTSPFPFEPHPAANLLPYGTAAPFSVASGSDFIAWCGRDSAGQGYVIHAQGFSPRRISTPQLEVVLQSYDPSILAKATGDVYDELGHTFYLLRVPDSNTGITWAWDSQTGWAKRGTWNTVTGKYEAWRPVWHVFESGQHRWLDASSGDVYRSSVELGTDVDSLPIRRVRRAPAIVFENQWIQYAGFELDLQNGLGLATGQGSDPQVSMRWSNDGGRTFSAERQRSAGKIGDYGIRVRWLRLGQARRRVFEAIFSDPIPWRITDAYLEIPTPPRRLSQVQRASWSG